MEYFIEKIVGSEDCLYVNVYTKDINPATPRPVIVWIHGGGFVRGSTTKDVHSPDYFMSKDVVFVSVAYRVGLFGFLSMIDPALKVPGNGGLKDQILGLKWVKDNIRKFGGDPNNVTLFGGSAGAAAVHVLAISEQSKGLFHRVICMSGSAFANWVVPPPKNWALRIAQDLGYTGPNSETKILSFLRKTDCKKIALSEARIVSKEEYLDGYMWCSYPVIEPYITAQCVVPQKPLIMARNAWSNEIPMIAGGTSREGIYFGNFKPPGAFEEWAKIPSLLLPFDLKQDRNSEHSLQLGDRIKTASFESGKLTYESFIDFLSFKLFWHPVHRMVQSRQKYAKAPTYLYVFEFDSPKHALLKTLGSLDVPGVSHGDDLGYLFNNMIVDETEPGSPERQKIEQFVGLWTQFAVNGDPNCTEIAPITWEPVGADKKPQKLLRIGREIKFEENPFAKMLELWDGLYEEGKLI